MSNRISTILFFLSFWCLPTSLFAQDPCVEAGYELSFAVVDVDCNGDATGEITVNSTGCDCFFSGCIMDWVDSKGNVVENPSLHTVTGLPADEYTVTVTHPNGCILTGSTVVQERELFVQDVVVSPIKCAGETAKIELVQTPLTGVLDITWSNGVLNETVIDQLEPGDYEFTAVNFLGCIETYSVSIAAVDEITYELEIFDACAGEESGKVNIVTEGGTPPFVAFLNSDFPTADLNLKNLDAGMHDVLLIDANDCQTALTFEISEEAIASPTIDASTTEICLGGDAELEANMNGVECTYSWTPASGLSEMNTQKVVVSPDETTTYTVVATSLNGCQSSAEITVQVKSCTSGIDDDLRELYSVHPNPNRGVFTLRGEDIAEMSIYDLVGRKVYDWRTEGSYEIDLEVNLQEESNGIYLMVLTQQSGQQLTVKIIKE